MVDVYSVERLKVELLHAGRAGLTHELACERLGLETAVVKRLANQLYHKRAVRSSLLDTVPPERSAAAAV